MGLYRYTACYGQCIVLRYREVQGRAELYVQYAAFEKLFSYEVPSPPLFLCKHLICTYAHILCTDL